MNNDQRIKHAQLIITGEIIPLSKLNNLITIYSNSRQHSTALKLFNQIPSPNVVSWTALISGNPNSITSLRHFISMLRYPTRPNQRTLVSVLSVCVSVYAVCFGVQVHTMSVKLGLASEKYCGSALVGFYSKCKGVDYARKVFDEMPVRDEVCYSSMIVGYVRNCCPVDGLSVFSDMVRRNVSSTSFSVSGALSAISELAALEQCRVFHGHSIVTGTGNDVYVKTGLVTAYGKCGMVFEARRVFDESLFDLNIIGWNAMMASYAHQGDKSSVLELFRLAKSVGLIPDEYTFLAVLTSLYNAGLANETEEWINKMRVDYKLEPMVEHYTCLVGVLGRVGRLDDAERIAMTMKVKPDAGLWRVLLSASAAHSAPETTWRMSKRLLEIDPCDDSAYVIAANAFIACGRRNEGLEIRKKMNNLRVKKEGGRSWIEVRGEVHVFLAGGRKHERMDEIWSKLEELMKEIGKLGYVPNWSDMVQDVEEGEKREGLSYHSEKLALAFGVVSGAFSPGKPIRILKNLRICRDCHEAFKYFSTVLDKEIIVRDVNRYHTFRDGRCTCGDYW